MMQYLTDDKGTVAIAVWGCPPLGHEQDAVRAMSFASQLVRDLDVAGYPGVSCGVTTGTCFTGNVGDAQRCE